MRCGDAQRERRRPSRLLKLAKNRCFKFSRSIGIARRRARSSSAAQNSGVAAYKPPINRRRYIDDHVVNRSTFLNIYSGALHGKFMDVSHSVHLGGLPCAIGTNRVYSSGRKKGSTGPADPGFCKNTNWNSKMTTLANRTSVGRAMRRFLHLIFVASILGYGAWVAPAAGQNARGVITGTAKDSADAPLSSTEIELQPLGRRVVTDDQGQFRITDVPAGEYTLTASYVGLKPFSTTVKVEPGQIVNLDPTLEVASQADQVVVTAERLQGEAEAINIERTSDEIVQVLPSRVYQQFAEH